MTKIAEELGVNTNILYTWISKYHRPQKQKACRVEEQHLYAEVKRLPQENNRLAEKREIFSVDRMRRTLRIPRRVLYNSCFSHHQDRGAECREMDSGR